jgi:hypothetical protein
VHWSWFSVDARRGNQIIYAFNAERFMADTFMCSLKKILNFFPGPVGYTAGRV